MMQLVLAAALTRWIVLNDVHLDPFDTRPAVVYGDDANRALLDSAISAMRHDVPDASVIVIGGDFLAHHFGSLARGRRVTVAAAAISAIRLVLEPIARAFPRAQLLPVLGNNDDPCGDYYSESGGSYLHTLAALFAPVVNRTGTSPDFRSTFVHGGYYRVRLPGGTRAIVLNSVLWSFVYRGGCQQHIRDPGATELRWARASLSSGENIVLMHIPPGYDPQSTTIARRIVAVPFLSASNNLALDTILRDERSHIGFALAAHTHRYDFRLPGGVPMLIASSLSPVYRNNPAFYVLDVEPSTGRLRNITPYVYDPLRARFLPRISFDAMYGVDTFTPQNLRTISARIESDDPMRLRWIGAYDVWSRRTNDVTVRRWRVFWCAQTHVEDDYASCAGTPQRAFGATAVAIIALVIAVAGVMLAIRLRRANGDRA